MSPVTFHNSLRALSCPLARALSMHGSRKGSDSPLFARASAARRYKRPKPILICPITRKHSPHCERHPKDDHRTRRNYLAHATGDAINAVLAAAERRST